MDMDLIFGDKKCHIIKILGQGTSSIVYKAKLNNRTVVLKELYPRDLGIVRGIDNSLIVPKNSLEIFEQYTEKFIKSFELQTEFHNNEKITNYTSDIEDIYECNNTLYTIMGIMTGNSYDNINPKNIMSVLKVGKSLAIAISYYHERNYLHLDIKPENIFILSETDELVQLFDFDTVSTKEDILQNKFSFSNNYASPEVRGSQNGNFELSDIDERADIFSIGVVIFEKIMGKLPNLSDHREGKTWNFSSNPYLKNTVPQLQDGITKIFQKTLARNKTDRYSSVTELIQDLDKLTELAAIKVFLKSQNISPCTAKNIYISRKNICETIWNRLNQYNILYLYAICGNGKSEIAREYAETYANSYNFIQSIFYSQNLKKTIANLDFVGLKYEDKIAHTDEDIDRLYSYKLDLLGNTDIYTSNTLLIIDNYDYDSNPESKEYKKNVEVWSDLKKLHIHIIFTTRINPTDKAHCFKLEDMSKTELEQLFFKINPIQKDDPERIKLVDEIIKVSYNHTMAVKLIALQSKKYKKSLEEYLSVLKENGLNSHIQGRITNEKDDESVTMSAVYDHIKALFDFDDLSPKEKYVMVNACLLPLEGLDIVTFSDFIDLDNFDGSSSDCIDESIEDLVNSGWIIHTDNEETKISLHPLICDIVQNELKPELTEDKCRKFYISFLDLISEWGNSKSNNCENLPKKHLIFSIINNISLIQYGGLTDIIYYILSNNDFYISNYTIFSNENLLYYFGIDNIYIIPNGIESIGSAFCDCIFLKQIYLPNSIKYIGMLAFAGCKSLNKINIPESVVLIDQFAFLDCISLEKIIIPDSVQKIGCCIFQGCTSLKEIKISEKIKTIPTGAFLKCRTLSTVILPENLEGINNFAFAMCTSLSEINIPNNLKYISIFAFVCCYKLKETVKEVRSKFLKDSKTVIENDNGIIVLKKFFHSKVSLEEYYVEDTINKIGSRAFENCSIKKIILPNSVRKIDEEAFYLYLSLEEIIIPDSVTEIGNRAFFGTEIKNINIPNSISEIGYLTFYQCTSLKNVYLPSSIVKIGAFAFSNCELLSHINIPEQVEKISVGTFSGCTSLTDIIIPYNIITIENDAFEYPTLSKITILNPDTNIENSFIGYYKESGLYKKNNNLTIEGYKGSTAEKYAMEHGFNFVAIDES